MTTTPLTLSELPALRALYEKATPGPWLQHLVDDTIVIDRFSAEIAHTFPEGGEDDDVDFATDTEQRERDAAFIAAARTALPAALDEIERLRAENERLAGCCDELRETTLALDDPAVNNFVTLPDAVRAMRAENERLREALRFYACETPGGTNCDCPPDRPDKDRSMCGYRARAALRGKEEA